jgi:hypothetical protein
VERRALAEGVAQRALHDARRNGLGVDELIDAIRNYEGQRKHEESL